jgi:hypothetical protein
MGDNGLIISTGLITNQFLTDGLSPGDVRISKRKG